ncbi:hypothetical protein EIN_097380 [Entamoeba invadens IP1]|uniref:Myb/SANT-like DNA-binding domain-containing protein n=1 Tax=Entamoeba invadens IP1 TaxID=370355 RepID=A0A0A1U6M0_ENTIV|nr:hypothetical protein EIN_097380 [Entamoeba invadens IP1]ELP87461.1 hypothetical protein EIN_097380 [Entamoeba invadens IP1]|eukprot:XP_004254232.1 hypothetical protein EIN_097380 [Entamoeba invadens IP1]
MAQCTYAFPYSKSMSAFTKIKNPDNYTVISSPITNTFVKSQAIQSDFGSSNTDDNSSRTWTEKATKYVLLKYFYWRYTEPSVMSLHETYKTIAASVALDLGITKTSTQIRDKINNIKSGYKKDQKGLSDSFGKDVLSLKYISPAIYDVMDKYFDEQKAKSHMDILSDINMDIYALSH